MSLCRVSSFENGRVRYKFLQFLLLLLFKLVFLLYASATILFLELSSFKNSLPGTEHINVFIPAPNYSTVSCSTTTIYNLFFSECLGILFCLFVCFSFFFTIAKNAEGNVLQLLPSSCLEMKP